jgi:hypothetical protein
MQGLKLPNSREAVQARARLALEVACERFRYTIEPPDGAAHATKAEQALAWASLSRALDEVAEAFEISRAAPPAPSTSWSARPHHGDRGLQEL